MPSPRSTRRVRNAFRSSIAAVASFAAAVLPFVRPVVADEPAPVLPALRIQPLPGDDEPLPALPALPTGLGSVVAMRLSVDDHGQLRGKIDRSVLTPAHERAFRIALRDAVVQRAIALGVVRKLEVVVYDDRNPGGNHGDSGTAVDGGIRVDLQAHTTATSSPIFTTQRLVRAVLTHEATHRLFGNMYDTAVTGGPAPEEFRRAIASCNEAMTDATRSWSDEIDDQLPTITTKLHESVSNGARSANDGAIRAASDSAIDRFETAARSANRLLETADRNSCAPPSLGKLLEQSAPRGSENHQVVDRLRGAEGELSRLQAQLTPDAFVCVSESNAVPGAVRAGHPQDNLTELMASTVTSSLFGDRKLTTCLDGASSSSREAVTEAWKLSKVVPGLDGLRAPGAGLPPAHRDAQEPDVDQPVGSSALTQTFTAPLGSHGGNRPRGLRTVRRVDSPGAVSSISGTSAADRARTSATPSNDAPPRPPAGRPQPSARTRRSPQLGH